MFITNIRLQDWLGKALQEIAQSENKSLAKTITDILTTAVMSTHVDEYIESLMYNETTRFLLIRSGNRFAFVLDDGHFPTKNDLVPTVNILPCIKHFICSRCVITSELTKR